MHVNMIVIQLLHLRSQQTPLLIVIEDLHWTDAASRDLLEDLIGTLAGARIVLLVNFRPEFAHAWAGLGHFNLLRLDPLRTDASAALLAGLLGSDPSLDALKASLTDRTGGNPFFLEESIRTLVASNGLVGMQGDYQFKQSVANVTLPATVHAVIAARVDRLSATDKRLLQLAAVIGIDVPLALLSAAADSLDGAAFDAAIRRLRNDEFLLPVRMFPDQVVRFKHALTHELVYASLLRQHRRDLHARVLEVLDSRATAMNVDVIEKLAYHAIKAEAWEKAATHARAAGLRSASSNATSAAIGHFTQALAALARLPPTHANKTAEIDLHLQIRDALFVSGEHDAIPPHLATAIGVAEEIGDARRLSHAKLSLSATQWYAGRHAKALETANEAMTIAEGVGDSLLSALSCYRRGVNLGALGRYRDSAESLRKAIRLLQDHELSETVAFGGYPLVFCHNFLTWTLSELGDDEAALAVGRAGRDIAWAHPNNYSRSVMSFGFGHALIRMGRPEEARTVLESGLAPYGIGEVPSTYPYIAAPLGYLLVATGHTEAGFAYLRQANDASIRRKAPLYAHVGIWMAESQRIAGDHEASMQSIELALDLARAQGEAGHEAWALRCLGDLLEPTNRSAARRVYGEAANIANLCGMRPLLADIHAHLD